MKLSGRALISTVRLVGCATFVVCLGSSLAAWTKQQSTRKSTDPPIPARGKLGQDLFLAIDHHDTAAVEALLKQGADPDSRNGLDFTPLYMAAASYQMDVMQALLKSGAKPDAQSTYGTPLMFAAASGNVPGANILFAQGANVNAKRFDGMTVLMMAANSGSKDFVSALIDRKADVNAADSDGATALLYAVRGGHADVAKTLLDSGASADAADHNGETPLMAASKIGNGDIVKLLIQKGASVNSHDSLGHTALTLAAAYGGSPEVIAELRAAGANGEEKDGSGMTAAGYASARGFTDCAKLLGAAAGAGHMRTPKEAVTDSLSILQSSMLKFSSQTGCLSCHDEGLGRMATGAAADHGFKLNQELQSAQMGRINGALQALQPLHEQALRDREVMKQVPLIEINEVNTADTWILGGMAAQKQPPTDGTAAMAMVLAWQQSPDGYWSFSLPRVPMQSSFFTFTALAIRALSVYGPKEHQEQIASRIERAKNWLLHAPAKTSEDRASCLLGLKWAGAAKGDLKKVADAIRADQRPDGGWSQLPELKSDAYATGQALVALRDGGGMSTSDPVFKKGVDFLLRTQDKDGSWFVAKRAFPANNYFDAGFPHGKSQYSSFNGTCWATMALLETLPKK